MLSQALGFVNANAVPTQTSLPLMILGAGGQDRVAAKRARDQPSVRRPLDKRIVAPTEIHSPLRGATLVVFHSAMLERGEEDLRAGRPRISMLYAPTTRSSMR